MNWDEMVELANKMKVTESKLSPEKRAELLRRQRVSWVYGNCKLDNPDITLEMVESAYDQHYSQSKPEPTDWKEAELHKT